MVRIMKKAQKRDFYREIRKSINRYLSLTLIVALGVAFFSGVRSAEPDMKLSVDKYYDSVNFYDIRAISTMGLADEDLAAIQAIEGVNGAEGVYSSEMFYQSGTEKYVLNVLSEPENINMLTVSDGRLPEADDECFMDKTFMNEANLSIGDSVTLEAGSATEISDVLSTNVFTIVGSGSSANYLSLDRDTSTIGNGKQDGFMYINKSSFKSQYYSAAYITVDGVKNKKCFDDGYKTKIDEIKKKVEEVSVTQCEIRKSEVKEQLQKQLDTLTAQYNKLNQTVSSRNDKTLANLQAHEAMIVDSKSQIRQSKALVTQYEKDLVTLEGKIIKTQTIIDDKQKIIDQNNTKVERLKKRSEEEQKNYDNAKTALASASSGKKEEAQKNFDEAEETLQQAKAEYAVCTRQIDMAKKDIEASTKELDTYKETKNATQNEIDKQNALIEEKYQYLNDNEYNVKLARQDYNDTKLETEAELAASYEKVAAVQKALDKLEAPSWYVLDRNSIQSYVEFLQDAQRVGKLGLVFPIIFFVVAALISLTTMTRMVEEQRVQIGTYKALGYSKGEIALKYLMYALSASLIGSIIGIILGAKLFPAVIIGAYKILYANLNVVVTPVNLFNSLISMLIAVACTTGAAFLACYRALYEHAAQLMRTQAPKHGKTILLEKAEFIWKRLNFSSKSTIRNLVRYKKRLFMTLFGIAGCMALLMVGFGLRDSISTIVDKQYSEIWTYDAKITFGTKMTGTTRNVLENEIVSSKDVESGMFIQTTTIDIQNEGNEKSVYLFVPQTTENLEKYLILKDRKTDKHYTLTDDGVIITEKLAKTLKVSAGDKISLIEDNSVKAELTVNAIAENYLYNYVYMTNNVYQNIYQKAPEFSDLYLSMYETGNAAEKHFYSDFENEDNITGITFVSDLQNKVERMMKSLDYVVWVLIVSAGLLAIIVLYNLININITERKRELATIKLLGFYDIELAQYVYRENIFLTIVGIVIGVFLGKLLHMFVIETTEIDMIMFGRSIGIPSYFYGIVLTFVFAIAINVWMFFKLRKIDMVESLKSME